MTAAVIRNRAALILITAALILAANSCDVSCEAPDPRGPDGWLRATTTASTP